MLLLRIQQTKQVQNSAPAESLSLQRQDLESMRLECSQAEVQIN